MIAAQDTFTASSEASPYNAYFDGPNKELGIITTGISFNYLSENYPDGFEHPVLKISQYPLPRKMVEKIVPTFSPVGDKPTGNEKYGRNAVAVSTTK